MRWFRHNSRHEPSPHAPAVEAVGLRKVYRSGPVTVEALAGIDLSICRGELVAIVGPSGCGKTTLLNCLAGLETDFAGEVVLAGTALKPLSDDKRARLRARTTGFIFQSFNLLPTLSAVENVEMPLLIAGQPGSVAGPKARAMLAEVGLEDRLHHRPGELSGGQQQRVAIARALVNEPAIVWADEPTGNLDSESTADILKLVRRLNEHNGQTFVIVTHSAEVAAIAGRVIRMNDGRITSDHMAPTSPFLHLEHKQDQEAAG